MKLRLTLLVVLAVASSASAQTAADTFRKYDRNNDGRVTPDELPNQKAFERYDTNKDSAITLEEYAAVIARKAASSPGAGHGVQAATSSIAAVDLQKITSGPEVLKSGDAGIGRMVPNTTFTTLDGRNCSLSDFKERRGLVILMTSSTCPVSKRYLPGIAKLQEELSASNLGLLLVNPLASEKPEALRAQLAEAGITADYVHDRQKQLSSLLQARTTTEAFLLDATRTLVYRGAFDDQYGANYNRDSPAHRYLHEAIASHLKGQAPQVQATAAPGCELDLSEAPNRPAAPVTYHRDVSRILQQNCVTCHRDGGIAPFALDDLEEVADRAMAIKRVVTEGTMPPWFAIPEKDPQKNPWANDCSLSPSDKTDLLAWISSKDRPLGNPADAPLKRTHPAEWSIGQPDLILPLSKAYDIKADGFMPYQFDLVQTELTEDKWVAAFEILPSERDLVHHVIVQIHAKGERVRHAAEAESGYWAVYVPGNGACKYPEGFARKLPAGAQVSFQIHYTPNGRARKERLRLGLVFAGTRPKFEVKTAAVAQPQLSIPPGAGHHVETKTQRVPFDMPVTGFMPHMHTRGAAFKYEVAYADGQTETLLDIPRYNFNWQLRYEYKQPKLLPKGSSVKITAVYDNSPNNKANPDPARHVKWGSQTVDEMMIGYLEYFQAVP